MSSGFNVTKYKNILIEFFKSKIYLVKNANSVLLLLQSLYEIYMQIKQLFGDRIRGYWIEMNMINVKPTAQNQLLIFISRI